MRKKVSGFVTVRAISGTYVVFLAFDMKEADAKGLMGFAIQRSDLTENETIWLRGNKTFASIHPSTGIEDASSHEHPFHAFQWADYAVKPGYTYKYKVIPMYGTPGHLTDWAATNAWRISTSANSCASSRTTGFASRSSGISSSLVQRHSIRGSRRICLRIERSGCRGSSGWAGSMRLRGIILWGES